VGEQPISNLVYDKYFGLSFFYLPKQSNKPLRVIYDSFTSCCTKQAFIKAMKKVTHSKWNIEKEHFSKFDSAAIYTFLSGSLIFF